MSAAPPRTATSLPQNGGNDVIRAATRRRHAASQLLMLHPPAGQIGNQRRAYSPRLVPNCGAGGRGQDLAGLQNDADHPPAHQAPPVWRATRELRDKRGLAVGLGRSARGRRGLDGMCTAMKSPTGVEGAGGSGGLGRASRSTTPSRRFTHGGNREARVARGAGPRCRWAAAGPGRASRSTTPSRRLACGDLAVGPPPTGTHSGPAHIGRPRGARKSGASTTSTHNATRPRPVSRPRPRHSLSATHRSSGTASDQAVMSTWSSTAARPASRRATGTRNGEQDT